jgi:hypothetical protein
MEVHVAAVEAAAKLSLEARHEGELRSDRREGRELAGGCESGIVVPGLRPDYEHVEVARLLQCACDVQ